MRLYCLITLVAVLVIKLAVSYGDDDENARRRADPASPEDGMMSGTDLRSTGASLNSIHHDDWIALNVGGQRFTLSKTNLCAKESTSKLARMFCSDSASSRNPYPRDTNGAYLIDRSSKYFEPILDYLRHGKLIIDHNVNIQGVLEEAKFYGMIGLLPMLETPSLTRQDVLRAIMSTHSTTELRFQGCDFTGADLSKLDLRNINLKYANLRGSNLEDADLSNSNLEHANLYGANLEGADLTGTNLAHANLENSNLKSINIFENWGGFHKASFKGSNMQNINLEGSQLAHVDLSGAILKDSNLRACNLKEANLSGADLRNCDFSGSNLHKTKFENANLEGAKIDREIREQ